MNKEIQVGDWVYASDWCYGQVIAFDETGVDVSFETPGGGGSLAFEWNDIHKAEPPYRKANTGMTVAELIAELQKMPQDAIVSMWMKPGECKANICWVERRTSMDVYLNDKYYTPYYEEDCK